MEKIKEQQHKSDAERLLGVFNEWSALSKLHKGENFDKVLYEHFKIHRREVWRIIGRLKAGNVIVGQLLALLKKGKIPHSMNDPLIFLTVHMLVVLDLESHYKQDIETI